MSLGGGRESHYRGGAVLYLDIYSYRGNFSWSHLRPSSGPSRHLCCHADTGSAIGEFESSAGVQGGEDSLQ